MVLCQPVRAPDDKILDQYRWYVTSMECWEEDGGGGGDADLSLVCPNFGEWWEAAVFSG